MIYQSLYNQLIINIMTVLSLSSCTKTNSPETMPPSTKKETRIAWDQQSRRKVSSALNAGYSGYARMIQMPDATLLCVYEADGNIVSVKSSDLGETWTSPVVIAPRANSTNMCVPDVLLLKDQTILV